MGNAAKSTRQNRTLTVDFHDETTYFALLDNTKAFVEFVLAFILSIGFQLNHKSTCHGGGSLTRHSHYMECVPPFTRGVLGHEIGLVLAES